MVKRFGVVFCFLALFTNVSLALESYSIRSLGMAKASITDDYHSNPATLALIDNSTVSLGLENRYAFSELFRETIFGQIKSSEVNVGLQFTHFGYSEYRDINTRLSVGKRLSPRISLGLSANMQTHKHIGSERVVLLGISPGILLSLPYNQKIGLSVYGLGVVSVDAEKSFDIQSQICYSISLEKHLFTIECAYTENDEVQGRAGYESPLFKYLTLRCGMKFPKVAPFFGVGTHFKALVLDLCYAYHEILRGIFGISLTVRFPHR